jgi:hypothetical protein
MRSLIQVYALLVCFCALMCFVIALGIGAYDVIEIAAPEFALVTYPYTASQLPELLDGKPHTDAERAAALAAYQRTNIEYQQQSALQSLVFVGIICAIDVVVFAIHWGIARQTERILLSASKSERY